MSVEPSKARVLKRLAGPAGFWSAAIDARRGYLYCGATDFSIYRYNTQLAADHPEAVLTGHGSYVTALAYSESEDLLLSGGFDRRLMAWKSDQATPIWSVGTGALVNHLAVSRDGRLAATAQDDLTVRIWEVRSGKSVRTLAGEHVPTTALGRNSTLFAVALSPDGRWLASGDRVGGIVVRELETGRLVARLQADSLYSQALFRNNMSPSEYEWGGVRSLAFSPDGHRLFAGGMGPADQNSAGLDGLMRIEVFEVSTARSVHGFALDKSKGVLQAMVVHPEGRYLVCAGGGGGAGAGGSGTLCLWDFAAHNAEGLPVAPTLYQTPMIVRDFSLANDPTRLTLVGMEKGVTSGRLELWSLAA